MSDPDPTLSRLLGILTECGARCVADIGCGRGGLSKALTRRGFDVTGIDPQAEAIEAARAACAGARFLVGAAEGLALPGASVDAALFLNSLHHVPEPAMQPALTGALRAVAPGGRLIVIEPLAEGSFFEAMRPVDDETAIRAQAIRALDALKREGACEFVSEERYARTEDFADLNAFLGYLARVDPARAAVIEARRDAVADAFHRHARRIDSVFRLDQPLCLWLFRKPR